MSAPTDSVDSNRRPNGPFSMSSSIPVPSPLSPRRLSGSYPDSAHLHQMRSSDVPGSQILNSMAESTSLPTSPTGRRTDSTLHSHSRNGSTFPPEGCLFTRLQPILDTANRRRRASSFSTAQLTVSPWLSRDTNQHGPPDVTLRHSWSASEHRRTLAQSRDARRINDSMVYLDGPQVYACAQCRTHLTSHDDIVSKSFHGRHGRAYLFDQCVNVNIGPAEDRRLMTGLHSVSDISCQRCRTIVGWTYLRAYETSQKYKEGKYIIEKINLHLEDASDTYHVAPPAGERVDRWRQRSLSWGADRLPAVVLSRENGLEVSEHPPSTCQSHSGNSLTRLRNVSTRSESLSSAGTSDLIYEYMDRSPLTGV